jgi:hypothetical protein
MLKILRSVVAVIGFTAIVLPISPFGGVVGQEKQPVFPLKEWEQDVSKRIDKDAKLKALSGKYPLVLLQARNLDNSSRKQSTFSFVYETSDPEKHWNNVHIEWGNGGKDHFVINTVVNQQNLVVDLGKADFEKNPDLELIDIDHPGLGPHGIAVEGHVYLERVRDTFGNDFYVVLQIVAVDPAGSYMAFIWRTLPGGKIVKEPKAK